MVIGQYNNTGMQAFRPDAELPIPILTPMIDFFLIIDNFWK